MNINIIPANSWSYRYILKQTKLFCCQHPFKMSQIDYFYYEDILFSVLKKEVQISTLCEDAYRYDVICEYIDYVFANKSIGIFGECNRQSLNKIEKTEMNWV